MKVREGGIGGMKEFKRLSQRVHSTFGSTILDVAELNQRSAASQASKWDPIWAAWDEIERTRLVSSWVKAWTFGRAGSSGNP